MMLPIDRHTIPANATIKEALAQLNDLSGTAMTLFALDSEGRLAGTVTDGDIRRALIGGTPLNAQVSKAMHRSFHALRPGDEEFTALPPIRQKGITLVPRLDADGRITEIIDLATHRNRLPIDAVLMAGGRGERLRPLTIDTPKPLLKVGGRPIIDRNVDELAACGVRRIYVTVNYLRQQIEDHFATPRNDGTTVTCVAEPARLGTIGSLALVKGLTHPDVLLMNSDLLTTIDFEALYAHHRNSGADLTIAAVPYNVSVPYAIIHTQGDRVTSLAEKPTFNYFANAGVYILRRELIGRLTPGQPLDAPDFIEGLIKDGLKVCRFPIEGIWIDIGSPDDFRYANELMARRGNTAPQKP